MKTIIISPYSARMQNGKENPKNYNRWGEVVRLLKIDGYSIIQIGVSGENKIEGVDEFLIDKPMLEIRSLIMSSDAWITVDNFLHHACALWKKNTGVVVWGLSDPEIFGYFEQKNLLKDRKFLKEKQYQNWEYCDCNPDAFVEPEVIVNAVKEILL